MDDLINRKGIVDKVCEGISCNECSFNEIDGESGCLLEYRIDQLPSAQKTGKWIAHDCLGQPSIDNDVCSACGTRFYQIAETGCIWNYCPSCGARMVGEEE